MKKINSKNKRKLRNRIKLKSVSINRFRISVSKSLKNISAQIIDDKLKKHWYLFPQLKGKLKKKLKKWRNLY